MLGAVGRGPAVDFMLLDRQPRWATRFRLTRRMCTAEKGGVNLVCTVEFDHAFHLAVETLGILAVTAHPYGGTVDSLQVQVALREFALQDDVEAVMAAQFGHL